METGKIRNLVGKIKDEYPGIVKLVITYSGYGDDISGFDLLEASDLNNNRLNVRDSLISDINEFLNYMLKKVDACFDGDGEEGEITFHFDQMTVAIDNYSIYTERKETGNFELDLAKKKT